MKVMNDECPVFLSDPGIGDIGYYMDITGVQEWEYGRMSEADRRDFVICLQAGRLWRTPEAVTKYPNNPAVYKLLQIIFRDFGGHGGIYLIFDKTDGWYSGYHSTRDSVSGLLTFKREPDVDKVVEEMGELMEFFK